MERSLRMTRTSFIKEEEDVFCPEVLIDILILNGRSHILILSTFSLEMCY